MTFLMRTLMVQRPVAAALQRAAGLRRHTPRRPLSGHAAAVAAHDQPAATAPTTAPPVRPSVSAPAPGGVAPAAAASAATGTPPPALVLTSEYGLPVPASLPEFEWADVHARRDTTGGGAYWIVIDGHIYDIARYARFHPGGGIAQLFDATHGTDRGAAFAEVHSWKEKRVTTNYCVGKIRAGSVNHKEQSAQTTTAAQPTEVQPQTATSTKSSCPFAAAAAASATATARH